MTYIKYSTLLPKKLGMNITKPRNETNTKMINYICSDGGMAYTFVPENKSLKAFA